METSKQLNRIYSILFLAVLFIRQSTATTQYACIESHAPVTRRFTTIQQYQTNNLRFNTKYNYVEFTTRVLAHLERNIFVTYDSNYIRKLTLANKEIRVIDEGAFHELFCVRYLQLQNNAITHIANGSFSGLYSIEELDLSRNLIENIPRSSFWSLKHLLKLDLSHNKINFISDLAFETLISLWELNLQHNYISELSLELFYPTTHLRKLSLAFNSISLPTTYDFNNLLKLDKLDLSNNGIFILSSSFFENLTTITDLNLSGNELTNLNVMSLPPQLTRLDIQNNKFQCFKLREILFILERIEIGVVVNQNTELKSVNASSVGCYNGRIPNTTVAPVKTTTQSYWTSVAPALTSPDTATVTEIPDRVVDFDTKDILDAIKSVKTMLVIFIIVLVLFHVVDAVLRTHSCSRLRQRQRMYPFPVGRGNDASLPLLNR